MKLEKIKCKNCGNLLAKPKYDEIPLIYRSVEFENHGDKSKIYDFTKHAIFETLRRPLYTAKGKFVEYQEEKKIFLSLLNCRCGKHKE